MQKSLTICASIYIYIFVRDLKEKNMSRYYQKYKSRIFQNLWFSNPEFLYIKNRYKGREQRDSFLLLRSQLLFRWSRFLSGSTGQLQSPGPLARHLFEGQLRQENLKSTGLCRLPLQRAVTEELHLFKARDNKWRMLIQRQAHFQN